jgi:DNA (cytosine-5)-methyltransferase 1
MVKLLDLFCGAGGAAMGYHQAGFDEIVGVDLNPQPRYPFEFVQADALEYVAGHGYEFDAIHASPPCQGYSIMRNLPWLKDREYPMLIDPVRELLDGVGKPWVIENVMGAHLPAGWLCGTMFGMPFYRHRAFESNWFWMQPGHPTHRVVIGSEVGDFHSHPNPVNTEWRKTHDGNGAQKSGVGVGHAKGWKIAAEAMSIDWMKREELTQAIPPAYTEYIGYALMKQIGGKR